MSTEVVMPQMGESIAEGTITKWLKKVGEHVDRDEPLFEISTDKVDAEIPSPAAGTLTEVRFKEGDTVEVNTVVAVLDGNQSSGHPRHPCPNLLPRQKLNQHLHRHLSKQNRSRHRHQLRLQLLRHPLRHHLRQWRKPNLNLKLKPRLRISAKPNPARWSGRSPRNTASISPGWKAPA